MDEALQIERRKVVARGYDCMDAIFSSCNIQDLTDGIYRSINTTYQNAQLNQINYLLNEIGCGADMHILDVGCGYGTLLEEAEKRGAEAYGISLSSKQAQRCHRKRLKVKVMDYRHIGKEWNSFFDGIVANGSMEHFVQPMDAVEGKANDIYREFFSICYRLLNPHSLITTCGAIRLCQNFV